MLLFIGGAARTGKGILARQLLAELQMPYLSLDVLKMGLARGVPEFDIDPDAGGGHVGERLWPLVREMSASLLRDRVDYVIEGELLPRHVAALCHAFPSQTKGCFLGYTTITPAQKLHEIRTHAGHPNDWSSDCSDADLLDIITRNIAYSRTLKEECAAVDMRYFDTSRNFVATLDQVVAYIRAAQISWGSADVQVHEGPQREVSLPVHGRMVTAKPPPPSLPQGGGGAGSPQSE